MSTQNHLNILGSNSIPVDQHAVITLTKENFGIVNQEEKGRYKIIKLSAEWKFNEVFSQNPKLDLKSYPNLLILIIEDENFKLSSPKTKEKEIKLNMDIVLKVLFDIFKNRSMILQLTSKDENFTKFYYKEENSEEFHDIKQPDSETKDFVDFPTFLWLYLNGKNEKLGNLMLKKLPKVKNSSLILKFLWALELSEDFYDKLVLKCSAEGSPFDLLAAIGGFITERGELQGDNSWNFLSYKFNSTSVLHTAILNSNQEVITFLVKNCVDFILQLPFEHQIEVSTAAFTTNKIAVLCDLLELCDFPFPKDLNTNSVTDEKLSKIINDRIKFHGDVLDENLEEIEKFVKENPNLKFAYSPQNKSAFWYALDCRKFKSFFRLKTFGFEDMEVTFSKDDIDDDEEKAEVSRFGRLQRRENVKNSIPHENNSVFLLASKTFIFRRPKNSQTEGEQRNKILNWYAEIYRTKFGSKLFDVAAQCDKLKIIFDFEYQSVKNVDVLSTASATGATYPNSKWIFIGACHEGEREREQKIKGVIAHEICHYVMRLVYQNDENPYYGNDKSTGKRFEEITAEIKCNLFPSIAKQEKEEEEMDEGKGEQNDLDAQSDDEEELMEPLDDECDGIIRTVYTLYEENEWHQELIVRPAHIQAQFDDDEGKIKQLEEKYKNLFEFWEKFVVPELEKFSIKERENVQNFNKMVGILPEVHNSKVKLSQLQDLSELMESQVTIITTNVPKILLLNIHMQLQQNCKSSLDFQNVFMTLQCLENSYTHKKFKEIVTQELKLNIFVDCSKGIGMVPKFVASCEKSKFIFIVSNEKQCEELSKNLEESKIIPTKKAINYNWEDLTAESHKHLLETKINFQNNSSFSLSELISNEIDQQQQQSVNTENLSGIIDDQLLNLLVDKSQISVNLQSEEEISDKHFRILFQSRKLIKNFKITKILPQNELTEEKEELDVEKCSDLNNFVSSSALNHKYARKQSSIHHFEEKLNPEIVKRTNNFHKNDTSEPLFEVIDKSVEMSLEKMIEDVKHEKFVLISDKAGSGKSWVLKSFTNKLREKYPRKWATYIDLKQFIPELKAQEGELEFATFITDKILKPKTKFETEIFKKLYKIGKVCILFDGFDEIAPDCAEFVTKLFQSFHQNGQNQLWIATRDYFEVDLKEKLELDAVYKLNEFTVQNGIEIIASIWMLNEMKDNILLECEDDILCQIKKSRNFKPYRRIAKKLRKKFFASENRFIGFPQFYKMIADISQNSKNPAFDFTMMKLFEKCVNIQYERWAKEKGKLRSKGNIASQHNDLNFHTLHELIAMESLFPGVSEFFDLCRESLEEWPDEEIIACGLLSKKGGKFFFSHETFREFYAAKFILRILRKPKTDEILCTYLIKFLTIQKFGIVRIFLNEAFGEKSTLIKIHQKMPSIVKLFCQNCDKLENLHKIFEEGLTNLADFLSKIFKRGNYQQMKEVIFKNKSMVVSAANHKELFIKIQDFVVDFFEVHNLKEFLLENAFFLSIASSNPDAIILEKFIDEVKNKTDLKFSKEILQIRDEEKENLLSYLTKSKHVDFKGVFKILEKFLDNDEIFELLRSCSKDGRNIFHVCTLIKEKIKMKFVWTELEQFFKSQNWSFKELFSQQTLDRSETVLHFGVKFSNVNIHETFWKILLNTFENRKELKDLMLQGDKYGNNFVHCLVILNKADIIEFTLKKIKETFNVAQYEEILKSKGNYGRNLLQIAASRSKDLKTHQILWKSFRDFCKSDEEFLEFLKEVDSDNDNVFHLAAYFSTSQILEFLMVELENVAPGEEIKKILNTLGLASRNLLHSAAIQNKSLELHQSLWKVIQKYFYLSEIVDFIRHADENGDNILLTIVGCSTLEIVDLIWNKMKSLNEEENFDLLEYLSHTNKHGENVLHNLVKSNEASKLKYFWKELQNFFDSPNSSLQFKELISRKTSENKNIFHVAARCDQIEFHACLWELLMDSCKNREALKEFIFQRDKDGDNFIHFLVYHDKPDIIEFTFTRIKEALNVAQYERILKSKGRCKRNLLQLAACASKDIKTYQILWKNFRDFCQSDVEFFEFLNEVDSQNNNAFHIAAAFTSSEIFELLMVELEKVASREEIRIILNTLGMFSRNFLQLAARQNESLEFHQSLWKIIRKYFDFSEIVDMVKHTDECGCILLQLAVEFNTKEIVELIWNEIKALNEERVFGLMEYLNHTNKEGENVLHNLVEAKDASKLKYFWKELQNFFDSQSSSQQYKEICNQQTSESNRNVLHYAAFYDKIEFHESLWELLLITFKNRKELKDLIMQGDKDGDIFIHCLVYHYKPDIIEFTFKKIKEAFSVTQYEEILKSKGRCKRNLIQRAACYPTDIKIHQILGKIFRDHFKSNEEFF